MLTLLPLVLFLLLILWIFVFPAKRAAASATDADVASGVQWLQEQEAHSPNDVEAELKAIRQAELDAMRDEWRAKLYSGLRHARRLQNVRLHLLWLSGP